MLRSLVTESIAVDRNCTSFSGIWSAQNIGQIDLMVGQHEDSKDHQSLGETLMCQFIPSNS